MEFMKRRSVRRTLLATATLALLAPGCAVDPHTGAQSIAGIKVSNDPCAKTGTAVGAVVGGVAGALLTSQISKSNEARVLGALGGAAIGGLIGNDVDKRRCELFRIAKKYNQDITATPIVASVGSDHPSATSTPRPGSASPETASGLSVVVKDSTRQFALGSDQLSPDARAFFLEIAEQYAYQKQAAKLPPNASREDRAAVELLRTKRVLLIGHTDDLGNSRDNAVLAERRAASVARLFRDQGIADSQVFYQGAGETFPVGDNRSEAGRAANRRVEIVEMADEGNFKKYLESRRPDYSLYRPVDSRPADPRPVVATSNPPQGGTIATNPSTGAANQSNRPPNRPAPATPKPQVASSDGNSNRPATAAPVQGAGAVPVGAARSPGIDFGGLPYNPLQASVRITTSAQEKPGMSFLSKAYADNTVVVADCTRDRPRAAGSVKSIRDGTVYKTNEHLPQLFGKTWAGDVNGNLVVVNRVAVLRDGGTPANLPDLKVYSQYKPPSTKKADIAEEPQVNSYLVDQGVLYRMFPRGDAGLKCIDILFAVDGSKTARGGKLIYTANAGDYVVDFKPQQAQ